MMPAELYNFLNDIFDPFNALFFITCKELRDWSVFLINLSDEVFMHHHEKNFLSWWHAILNEVHGESLKLFLVKRLIFVGVHQVEDEFETSQIDSLFSIHIRQKVI